MRKLDTRLERLESASADKAVLRAALLRYRSDAGRWEVAAYTIERLLGGAAGFDEVLTFLRGEAEKIPDLIAGAVRSDLTATRALATSCRVRAATVMLFARLPRDRRMHAAQGLYGEARQGGWAADLIRALARLECRIAPDVPPVVVAAVADAFAAHASGEAVTLVVCSSCGLPRVDACYACPHCGEGHAVTATPSEGRLAWQVQARQELDDYRWRRTAGAGV